MLSLIFFSPLFIAATFAFASFDILALFYAVYAAVFLRLAFVAAAIYLLLFADAPLRCCFR